MSGELDIDLGALAGAAEQAAATMAGSAVTGISPPNAPAMSQMDAALARLSTSSEALRRDQDAIDATWATNQAAALAEAVGLHDRSSLTDGQPAPPAPTRQG